MNRLTEVVNETTTAQFWYDGLNRQIARSASGSSTLISVMDGWNTYAEFAPAATTPTEELVYGAGGDLVQAPRSQRYYYPDALGSTAYLADGTGALLESYTYDLYGRPSYFDPSGAPRGTTAYGITRLYAGQQWHAYLGLYNMRNRFLHVDLGRFLQPDPIGFSGDPSNLYRYCGNNPANGSDPFGTEPGFGTAFGFVAGGIGGAYQTYVQTHSIGLSAASFVVGGVAGAFAGSLFEGFAPEAGVWAGSLVTDFAEGAIASYAGQVAGNVLSHPPSQIGPNDLANINPGLIIGAGVGNLASVSLRGLLPARLVASGAFRGVWSGVEGLIGGNFELGGGKAYEWLFAGTDPDDGAVWFENGPGHWDATGLYTYPRLIGVGSDPGNNDGSGASGSGGSGSGTGGRAGGGSGGSINPAWASYVQGTANGYGGGSPLQRLAALRHR